MARSSGRYSKYPKVNRDIPPGPPRGEAVPEEPNSLTSAEIKELLAVSRRNSGLLFIPEEMSPEPEVDADEPDPFTEELIEQLTKPLTQEEIDRPKNLLVTIVKAPEEVHPPEKADVEVPNTVELSIPKVMAWVDGDKTRASLALATEERQENPRVTLVSKLKELLTD